MRKIPCADKVYAFLLSPNIKRVNIHLRACASGILGMDVEVGYDAHTLHLLSNPLPKQPRGPKYQNQYQYQKSKYIFVFTGYVAGAEAFHKAEQQAAKHGAGDVADAAEDCRGKCLDACAVADKEIHRAVIHGNHYACRGSEDNLL